MHLRKLWLLAGVVLAALAIVTTGSASQQSAKASGTVIFGADQEPGILNTDIIGGNLFWGAEAVSPVFPSTYRVYPDFSFRPELAKATVQTNPFRLTYHINKRAVWYEAGGATHPITAADYIAGWRTIMTKDFKILSQVGYEDIKSAKAINKKTVRFTFSKPFAGWKTLFASQVVVPSFAIKGEDFNKVWINDMNNPKTGKPISGGPFNDLLKNLKVRQAIAYGIDRRAMVNALYTKTDIAPGLPVLNDPIILTGNKFYKGHWKGYTHNAKKAISLMKSAGCTGGPATPGAGGVWTCNGTKASFKFKWRSGNQLRQLSFEAMQAQLKDVGIQLVADDTPNALSQDLPNGNYDIILFAWVGSPDISGWDAIYGCRSGSDHAQDNNQGYCNRSVDKALVGANHQLNPGKQYALTNKALATMAKDGPKVT